MAVGVVWVRGGGSGAGERDDNTVLQIFYAFEIKKGM